MASRGVLHNPANIIVLGVRKRKAHTPVSILSSINKGGCAGRSHDRAQGRRTEEAGRDDQPDQWMETGESHRRKQYQETSEAWSSDFLCKSKTEYFELPALHNVYPTSSSKPSSIFSTSSAEILLVMCSYSALYSLCVCVRQREKEGGGEKHYNRHNLSPYNTHTLPWQDVTMGKSRESRQ